MLVVLDILELSKMMPSNELLEIFELEVKIKRLTLLNEKVDPLLIMKLDDLKTFKNGNNPFLQLKRMRIELVRKWEKSGLLNQLALIYK